MLAVTVGKENRLQARRTGYRLSVGPREGLGKCWVGLLPPGEKLSV